MGDNSVLQQSQLKSHLQRVLTQSILALTSLLSIVRSIQSISAKAKLDRKHVNCGDKKTCTKQVFKKFFNKECFIQDLF